MNYLAIDTSTMISTVTVADDKEILGDFNVNQAKTHSESLVPMIESLLRLLGMTVKDIDKFVIAEGPGSFTGLRIGMTIAKTLAQVENKDLLTVSTLKAMAAGSTSNRAKLALLDARSTRVYGALFDENLEEIIPQNLYEIDDLSKIVNEKNLEIEMIGLLNDKYFDKFERAKKAPININNCLGGGLIRLAQEENLKARPLYEISPNYLRKSQAEREYGKK
ncbi:tRNA (adenosine(37)-N6)-threonylcarbamoyltransferase complex dimerization subunit type 1 TsaB [uncultured Anaerococcus sp.]|uniref:tRNA (adenosine(37)-N6)-threonylcarbamoyltransferase complex dimerization subunit type 1 TsaB n=1 Tax=uncultured Anaerococcus sp. TaxID=293428 RepID=UPI0026399E02|nr:tRNA (adenosine(37)-N6)-threonylcarbamoyltransferase complex dimerization subunit type 1 TsaB [uncultured Anaerococcus sp.]